MAVQFLGLGLDLTPSISGGHRGDGRKSCCKKLTKNKTVVHTRYVEAQALPFGGNFLFAPLCRSRQHVGGMLRLLSSETQRTTR